jgi:hypothetical protein
MGRHSKTIPYQRTDDENEDAFFIDGERIHCDLVGLPCKSTAPTGFVHEPVKLPHPKGDGPTWEDVPAEIENTFDKLGIPDPERKSLAGVTAVGGAR